MRFAISLSIVKVLLSIILYFIIPGLDLIHLMLFYDSAVGMILIFTFIITKEEMGC